MKRGTISIFWSDEDQEYVAIHSDYPSLSYLANAPAAALEGLLEMIHGVELVDLRFQIVAEHKARMKEEEE